jgi:hypothetical protein
MKTVPVYEWQFADGSAFGLGTEVEFNYWRDEGVNPADAKLGPVLCHEPASEDDRRRAAWKLAA